MLRKLWRDEAGVILTAELILLMTVIVIGVIVGLAVLRDAVVTELADSGAAIAATSQQYTVGGITGFHTSTAGSHFVDLLDAGDDGSTQSGPNSRCIILCETAGGEGTVAP